MSLNTVTILTTSGTPAPNWRPTGVSPPSGVATPIPPTRSFQVAGDALTASSRTSIAPLPIATQNSTPLARLLRSVGASSYHWYLKNHATNSIASRPPRAACTQPISRRLCTSSFRTATWSSRNTRPAPAILKPATGV